MWQNTNIAHNQQLTDSSVNNALQSALSAAKIPADLSQSNSNHANAKADKRRELLASGIIKTALISPWNSGTPSRNKYSMSFYLSPADATEKAAQIIESSGFETAILIAEMGDTAAQLAVNLKSLSTAFPSKDIEQAARHASALAEHEQQKRFLQNEQQNAHEQQAAALKVFRIEEVAAQNISVSEAVASDEKATQILASFKAKRTARLAEIQQNLSALNSAGGIAQYVIKLSGGNLADKLRKAEMPNQHAPLTVIFIMGGTNENMAKVSEVLGL